MKRLLFIMAVATAVVSCKKDKKKNNAVTTNPPVETGSSRGVVFFGNDSMVAQGNCGTDNSFSYMVISIQDATNPQRGMSIALNTFELPAETTVYNLVESGMLDEDNEAILDFYDISGSAITGWNSVPGSGTITISKNGDEYTCNFTGIPVSPYAQYNEPPYDVQGTAKGSFVFTAE